VAGDTGRRAQVRRHRFDPCLGDAKLRDDYFDALANKTPGQAGYKNIGKTIRGWMKNPEPADEPTIKKFLDTITPSGRADVEFYVAWYLRNRGVYSRAVNHWKHSSQAAISTQFLKVQAAALAAEYSAKKDHPK